MGEERIMELRAGTREMIENLREFYQKNMYGIWREGENVTYELLGEDSKSKENDGKPRNPFEIVGGDLVKIKAEMNGRRGEFVVHVYVPEKDVKVCGTQKNAGSPFIICMHPIMPKDLALSQGYAVIVMESIKVASDDTKHIGAFYDLYPYGEDGEDQTGVLMAWAWGASKVLDAVYNGLDKEYDLDADASMVTGVSRWGKSTAVCGAFDRRFRMTIPACSGAGGLAQYNVFSEGNTYDLTGVGGTEEYTYGKNEPLDCLQSDGERGWFNDSFLQYKKPSDIPYEQDRLPVMAMDVKRYYFIIAACMGEDWVNAPAMWECYKKADKDYRHEGLQDHLVVHFHKEGHAVLEEDMKLIVSYFNKMYYGMDTGVDMKKLKTTVFNGQEK